MRREGAQIAARPPRRPPAREGRTGRGPWPTSGGARPAPARRAPRAWPGRALTRKALEHRGVGLPHLVHQLARPGTMLRDAGVDVDHAEVRHAPAAAALDDQIAGLDRVLGGGQEAVAAALHRRGPGVIGLADEDRVGCGVRRRSPRRRRWESRPPRAAALARCAARRRRPRRPAPPGPRAPARRRIPRGPSRRPAARRRRRPSRESARRRAGRRTPASRTGCRSGLPRRSTPRPPADARAGGRARRWRAGTPGRPSRRARRRGCRLRGPCRCASPSARPGSPGRSPRRRAPRRCCPPGRPRRGARPRASPRSATRAPPRGAGSTPSG